MKTSIGFTAINGGSPESRKAAEEASNRVLGHFKELDRKILEIGETELHIWGRGEPTECTRRLPDRSLLILTGSPEGDASWPDVEEELSQTEKPEDFKLPWEGRVVLLKISPDGTRWTLWNDWLGSIPVYHARLGQGCIATTIEPAAVDAVGPGPSELFLPALLSLLIHGNFIGDWTLFRNIKTVPPDCAAEWDATGFHYKRIFSVKPTDSRWESGWDELVDEMHALSRRAVMRSLKAHPRWILPLSGGFDSRLIASVGAAGGIDLRTYTWGAKTSRDALYARRISKALGLPWKWIDPGEDYLTRYLRTWSDLFGSSMHFHGMYQMAFLDALRPEPPGPMVSGYIGECMAGYDVLFLMQLFSSSDRRYQSLPDGYLHWLVKEMQPLFRIRVTEALETLADEIERQCKAVEGPLYQRLRFLTLRGRQRCFTYFSSMLFDYWRSVATPFLDRDYARFCFSLPRPVLEERRLQADVFRRYYRRVETIPWTYSNEPITHNGSYFVKKRIARLLPKFLLRGSLRDFNASALSLDGECFKKTGKAALWPVQQAWDLLGEWFHMEKIEEALRLAEAGDVKSLRKLQSIQAFAFRLMNP